MRRTIAMAGIMALVAACLSAQEPRTNEPIRTTPSQTSTTLPLNLNQGQTFEFRVQVNERGSKDYQKPEKEEREESGVGAREETVERPLGETRAGELPDKTDLGGAEAVIGSLGETKTCRFSLRVEEAEPNGNATLEVKVSHEALGARIGERPDDTGGLRSRAGDTGKSDKIYNVRIDRDGHILSFNAATGIGTDIEKPAKTGHDDHAGHAGPMGQAGYEMPEHKVRCALQAMFGSGLHNKELIVGQVYMISPDISAVRAAGTPTDRPEKPVGETNRSGTTPTVGGDRDEDTIRLRFEGATTTGLERTARFSVLSPKAGIGALPGRTDPDPARDPMKDPARDPDRAAGDIPPVTGAAVVEKDVCGQATYRVDDGLLEELTVNHDLSKKAGKPETGAKRMGESGYASKAEGKLAWMSIRRISGLDLTEPDRR